MSKNIFLRQFNSPNIVIEPTEISPNAPIMNQPRTKQKYFDEYVSPNIVIVPTATSICSPPSPKRIKLDTIPPNQSPEYTDISFLDDFNIDEIVACLNSCDNIQETEINYEINQTAQYEPIEQTVLNKNDLIKPHEDFINHDTNTIDNVEDSLKPVEYKNITNIKINGYKHVEKSKTGFEIDKKNKKETLKNNNNHTQIDIRCTERPSARVTCESVEHKKERTKRKLENDIDNCIIININVHLVVNGCRDIKKCLKSKSATENETIIKDEHAERGNTESKTLKDRTGIEQREKLESKPKTFIDITPIEEKKKLEGELTSDEVTSVDEPEPTTTEDITSTQENKKIERETKATVNITSIKENIKLEGELTTGEVTTVDITPIKQNKRSEGETNTTVNKTFIKENKKLEGEPKTTIDIASAEKTKKLEGETKATLDITPKKENIKLRDEPNTTVNITFIKENKKFEGKPKITVDIASAEKTKKLKGETKATLDITSIKVKKKLKVKDKHMKPIKEKTSDDVIIFKTEENKLSIASANTDVLELRELEQQIYNFLNKKISVLSTIHSGNYSKIFKCKDSIGEEYAVKMLNTDCHTSHGSSQAIMLQKIQLDIPKKNLFCIYLYESFTFNGHRCFLQDYYPKNLNQAIEESAKPFNINMTQDLASQLVGAVLLLRNNNIVHSDIKPNHILLNSTNTKLKLCGFDNAHYLNDNTHSNIGALNYRSPEEILGCPAGFSIDVWSTALVLYEMVTGNKLFPGCSDRDMLYRQMKVLGSIPQDMISISLFRNKYFHRGRFLKSYYNKRSISLNHFTGDNTIHDTVYHVYTKHWGTRDQKDQKKLDMFLNLLKKMLVLHPKRRLGIALVCANPFIYELFCN